MSDEADLAGLLAPMGWVPQIGSESEFGHPQPVVTAHGFPGTVVRYDSPHGSVRYMMVMGGDYVGALQVVMQGDGATVANVYVARERRRQGIAESLLARARQDFGTVRHAKHQTSQGRKWSRQVRAPRRLNAAETRAECGHIQEWLYSYLSTDVDPFDFGYAIKDWIEQEEIEGFEDPYETYPDDLSQAQLKAFTKWLKKSGELSLAIREIPYEAPAYLTLHAKSKLPYGSWFVHFTNASFGSFDRGSTLEGLHLSTWKKRKDLANCSRNLSDQQGLGDVVFVFAYDADNLKTPRDVRAGSQKYGRNAVLFQCDCAVEAYHDGDEEYQSIFPACSEYNLHRVSIDDRGDLSVEVDGEDVEFDTLGAMIEFLEKTPEERESAAQAPVARVPEDWQWSQHEDERYTELPAPDSDGFVTMFHGTSKKNVASIRRQGITPQRPMGRVSDDFVFLTTQYRDAEFWSKAEGDGGAVFAVRVRPVELERDTSSSADPDAGYWVTRRGVQPNQIKLARPPRDAHAPIARDMDLNAPIHPTQFAALFLANAETGDPIEYGEQFEGDPRVDVLTSAMARVGVPGPIEFLGYGSFGVAGLAGGHVVKLTADAAEVQVGSVLVGKDLPHVVAVYGSWFVRGVKVDIAVGMDEHEEPIRQNARVGILIEQAVESIEKEERQDLSTTVRRFKEGSGNDFDSYLGLSAKARREKLLGASQGLESLLRHRGTQLYTDVADALAELRSVGVYAIDVHGGNVGWDASGERFRVFDVGVGSPPPDAGKPPSVGGRRGSSVVGEVVAPHGRAEEI